MSDVKKFCDLFRCDKSPGKRYYKRLPMSFAAYTKPLDIMDLQTHEEEGIRLEMASSDFERLMIAASEGLLHQRFRQLNPAARELYEQYMSMYILTKNYMSKDSDY